MFAIDDTGHERLKGQSIYGLGGCAVMGRDYYRVISDPWTRRRAATTGDFGGRLRAAEFGRRATPANMAAMGVSLPISHQGKAADVDQSSGFPSSDTVVH